MNQLRASRLKNPGPGGGNWFDQYFPHGTWRRKLLLGLGIPAVVFLVLVLIADKIVMPIITRQGSEFELPDFTSQRVSDIQLAMDDLDLSYEIASEEYSPGKAHGIILQQFPEAGTNVKPGRVIKLVVSLGQKMQAIPNLAGRSVRQAMLDLEAMGLTLGEIAWAFSDTIPDRVVVFSYPAAGTEIPLGSSVNLMVNRGRASNFTFMPQVVGLALDEATEALTDKQLKVGVVTYRVDENYLPETVLEQSESHGTELDVNTEIDLVVSSG